MAKSVIFGGRNMQLSTISILDDAMSLDYPITQLLSGIMLMSGYIVADQQLYTIDSLFVGPNNIKLVNNKSKHLLNNPRTSMVVDLLKLRTDRLRNTDLDMVCKPDLRIINNKYLPRPGNEVIKYMVEDVGYQLLTNTFKILYLHVVGIL